jgi:hypothetical protein
VFKLGEGHSELIICLLYVLKWDFSDVGETVFHDESPFKSIFYILVIQKSGLYEVPEMMS